jgi:hypothetical protein
MPPNPALLVKALRLPAQALVDQRIAKKLLVEQGAPTAADKRLINDTVDELWWHAALKPVTVSVPAFVAPPVTVADTSRAAGTNAVQDVIELALLQVAKFMRKREPHAIGRLVSIEHDERWQAWCRERYPVDCGSGHT